MSDPAFPAGSPRIWQVGALCRAVADSLDARFNPVAVRGEITGFSRAASGHLYFSLKDATGQIRCAMFRRAASLLEFAPQGGELVEVFGRLGVYEARGDLQLIVESISRAGQGALFEQFLRLKARLESEGLFDAARKRPIPSLPRGIGLVTSRGAAALHDVMTAMQRRAPHVPVVFAPASVQGSQSPAELIAALRALYGQAEKGLIDVILLVRGGGSMEDLWSFNDEWLARCIVESPVPLVCGVGHETDFTIADFCADLRAPTPTAAAELAARPRDAWMSDLQAAAAQLQRAVHRRLDVAAQRTDQAAARLGRPLGRLAAQEIRLGRSAHRLRHALQLRLEREAHRFAVLAPQVASAVRTRLEQDGRLLDRAQLRLELLDPKLVLQRGYALLEDADGRAVTSVGATHPGQRIKASLADGTVDLTVTPPALI
ncbi:exodeoxyribonuclease VII large subunit [Caenimonas koreensis DSM 17982]|uniref:Exodeoxyribonuclease 7 large subunit n=1 Tax=Caenimonas koreensis DSM 17982 TaxID=1121255 RepID=A0A844BD53_9BURK|nr:exodeoxyribonuclease VII large subunit [Caenimonas koreensis]MRD48431.1 exodeoxyribonuclease VII large subunit [Caenimonas koreensis DSM 17982]